MNTHKILNNEPAVFKFGIVDYDGSLRLGKKFGENRCTGGTLGACVTYCTFVPFYAKLSISLLHSCAGVVMVTGELIGNSDF